MFEILFSKPILRQSLKIGGTLTCRTLYTQKQLLYNKTLPQALKWRQKYCCAVEYSNVPPSQSDLKVPPTANILKNDAEATVVLLGTVHFSKKSVEDVTKVVEQLKPNAIMIELCRARVSLLELDDKKFLEEAKNFNPKKVREAIKGQDFVSGTLHAILLKSYADVANELGVAPGGEFRRAYQEMKKIPGCKLFLGDRPIQITMARAFRSLNYFELLQLMYHLSAASPKPINKEMLEKYKERDYVDTQLQTVTRDFPAFRKIFHVFVDERDKCLAFSLQECVHTASILNAEKGDKPRVLAVVGIGHVPGIDKYFGKMKANDILPLLSIPKPPLFNRIMGSTIKFTFYFLVFSLLYRIVFG